MADNVDGKAARKMPVRRALPERNGPGTTLRPVPQPASQFSKHGSGGGLWIWLTLGILVAAGLVYWFLPRNEATTGATAGHKHGGTGDKVRVVGAVATSGDIGVYLTGLGTVTPLATVNVKTRVDGELMKVLFTEGQLVKQGDLLVQIDSRPYDVQLGQAQGQLLHDQALLQNANIDLDRYQTLWKQDSIPKQTLDTQQALVTQDEGTVKTDQASVDSAKLNISYCNIAAPIGGRIGLRNVDQGNLVHAADTTSLLVITQLQPITILFTIPEDSIQPVVSKLSAGQTLTVEAYSRDMKTKLADGTLLTSDNQIDQTTGTLRLKAIFENENGLLFPNQFVNVRLLVEMKRNVILTPVAAIQHGPQNTFVYLVDTDQNTVSMKEVTVGTIDGSKAEIQSGVAAGETVVIDGVDKLQDGGKVILQSAGDGGGTSAGKGDAPKKRHQKDSSSSAGSA